jgi:predicted DNA-binding helix-hairpin-helix protein
LKTASDLYHRHRLRRVYYSAFSPIPHGDSRLPVAAPPLIREHRLYQADWLLRFYGFRPDEITPDEAPSLDLEIDPKLSWAFRNRAFFPVDLNRDDYRRLLRVPGLGKRNVMRICQIRRYRKLRLIDLPKLRVPVAKVRPWVKTEDHNPDLVLLDRQDLRQRLTKPNVQLELFAPAVSAVTGEV